MSLARVPELRKTSIIAVIGTVTLLILASFLPRLTVTLAYLAIIVYSVPYLFFVYIWPRKREQKVARDIWVRELTPEAVKEWYENGRLTKDEDEKMIHDLENNK